MTSDGIKSFEHKIRNLTIAALVAAPDSRIVTPDISFPVEISFGNNQDDLRLYTPALAHRRVRGGALEFGSLVSYGHSWASLGKERILNFVLEFEARFINPSADEAYIGVGVRSQHYYANFAHVLYLKNNGIIVLTMPDEKGPGDKILREPTHVDLNAYHSFQVRLDESVLNVRIDDFSRRFPVAEMKKVLGPGLIRFQAFKSWMAIRYLKVVLRNVT